MAKDFSRTDRVAGQLQRELALMIHNEVKDPRVGFVTVTAVHLSKDMSHAKVYFTLLDENPQARKEAADALNHAAGFLRHLVGQQMRLRVIPHLVFNYDEAAERGMRLSALIEKAVAEDHEATDSGKGDVTSD